MATTTVLGGDVASAEALEAIPRLHTFVQAFETDFSAEIGILNHKIGSRPLVICSCYNPCFGPYLVGTVSQGAANTAIALMVDAILQVATRYGCPALQFGLD